VGTVERRVGLLFLVFALLLLAAGARASYLGLVKHGTLSRAAATQQVQTIDMPAPRGNISDRNGVDLAVSEPADDVVANPRQIRNAPRLATRLAPLLGVDANALLPKLSDRSRGFVYVARQVPATATDRVRRMKADGLSFIPSMRRAYPRAFAASQVLGMVGVDGKPLAGLELGENEVLGGQGGVRRIVSDALGQPISITDNHPVKAGEDVRLTLDAALQDQVERVLDGVGQAYRPKGATAIVMDPRNGDVLALANWPRVDANDAGNAPAYARQDRAVGFTYEPGSTFKAFTVAAALQDRKVTPETPFALPVELQVADRRIHDAHERGPETLTVSQILAQSSNVGAALVGMRLGKRRFDHWVRSFGFGRATGIGLPGEEQGIVLPWQRYSGSSMGNLPIGQGEAVTPLQMAMGYTAIANGGVLRRPRLIAAIDGKPVPPAPGRRVISAATSSQVREMLRGVLAPGGTASEASIPGYDLAGKTGTAEKPDPVTGTYSKTRYIASFVGFAPAHAPRLLVTVMVDEPQGSIYGGEVAAPAFTRIAAFAMPYLGIPPR